MKKNPTTPTADRPVHPSANVLPMLSDDELDQLADSIRQDGLLQPLVLTPDGALLDGRNRLEACRRAGVEPAFVVHDGDPVSFVAAANVHRRHMSTGARAVAIAIMLKDAGRRRNGRWQRGSVPKPPDTPESGSKAWHNQMHLAGRVLDNAPDLAPSVIAGTTSLHAAAEEANRRAQRAAAEAANLAHLAEHAPDLHRRVTSDEDPITLAEAMDEWREWQAAHRDEVKRRVARLRQVVIGWCEVEAFLADDPDYPRDEILEGLASFADRVLDIAARVDTR